MDAVIISPYAGTGQLENPYRPLILDVLPNKAGGERVTDITGRSLRELGLPGHGMCVYDVRNITGQQLASIKSDSRFFVLSPGPGNTGSALTTWLSGKGMTGHGVTNSDTAEEATAKLRDWCRRTS